MQYQAIFLDLDGTLLNPRHQITRTVRDSILGAQNLGVHIVINSGRTPAEIEDILKKAELTLSYIALNGAYVYDCKSNSVLYRDIIRSELQKTATDIAEKMKVYINWYTRDKIYINYNFSKIISGILMDHKATFISFLFHPIEREKITYRPNDFFNQNQGMFYKGAFICGNTVKTERLRNELKKSGVAEISASSRFLLEFNNRNISKKSGMEHYLKHYSLSFSQCIAVGDHENDLSMIKAAALGVAMGNAISDVKRVANFITTSNSEDGVAKVIHDFIIQQL
jgi:Cof subfamily protein (haloacid dehalogenase superfamily)